MAFILIVDDIEEIREVYTLHLENAGHRVRAASNGLEAIEMALELVPDIILMDVDMPEMNGIDALRSLKQDATYKPISGVPVVLLTCHALPDQVKEGLDAGCDAYIIKPHNPREIVEELLPLLSSDELV